jgi:hypothetical protein
VIDRWPPLLLAIALLGSSTQTPPRTELVIRAVGPGGQPLTISRAELYLDYWGGGDTIVLPSTGATVRVPLGRDWLCREHAELCEYGYLAARIVVRAKGHAPIGSDRFTWIGSTDDPKEFANRAGLAARVRFPRHGLVVVGAETRRTMTVTLRSAGTRTVKVVDERGSPVPDAELSVIELMARSNHTAYPEGPRVVEHRRTDDRGVVTVPDADMTYALLVRKPHHRLVGADDHLLERRLVAPVTLIHLERLRRQPLRLAFVGPAQSAAPIHVQACLSRCQTGACCGFLGETDSQGWLTIEDFHPDEFESVFVAGEGTTRRWEIDPGTLGTGRLTVTLR